jgi:lysophospholipase L1-like esterase
MRSTLRCAVAAIFVAVIAIGSATEVGSQTSSGPPLPSTMLAIGDSFSVGFASGASQCPSGSTPCLAVSWSTGDSITSHYARILALNPAIEGQQRNGAAPGATMNAFASQVAAGGASAPQYATVMLGAGDLCFGGPTSVTDFTAGFQAGMDALVAANPSVRVLVASVWNLESLRQAVLSRDPTATWSLCGNILNATSPVSDDVMTRIREYNAALETSCATYSACRFDGGAFFAHVWTGDEISVLDNLHPSAKGQEKLAEILWNVGYWPPSTETDRDPDPSVPEPPVAPPDPQVLSPDPEPATSATDEPAAATPRFTG